MKIIGWVKNHIAATILIVLAAYFIYNTFTNILFGSGLMSPGVATRQLSVGYEPALQGAPSGMSYQDRAIYPQEYAPQPDVEDRLVIRESNISLLVKDVNLAQDQILNYTREKGGYMVSTGLSNPEDAPTSTVVIRIPSDKLDETLDHLDDLSVKVVSENLSGRDVTDEYVDIEQRLQTLEDAKARFEAIVQQAEETQDIINATQQILNYQRQIDQLKGRQQALEQNAQLAKLTIYLATDELALPYTPSETWRPEVIFKQAVRSLITTLRGIGTVLIVVGVYAAIWVPALVIFWFIRRYYKKRRSDDPPQQAKG